jgi:glycosyltransferase involved in cell wall biosynthesis
MRTPDFQQESIVARRPHHVAPSLASVRVVLASELMEWQPAPPGSSEAGLAVTANNTAKVLRRAGVQAEAWRVRGGDDLMEKLAADAKLAKRQVTHVIINNPRFIPPNKIEEMALKHPDIEFVQLNHSGLAYLSIDEGGVQNIRQTMDMEMALHNVRVAGNNPRFTKWQNGNFGSNHVLLPNLYDLESFKNPVPVRKSYDPLRVGSFGAGRPWKNQLIAAEAALTMARRLGVQLELYVNSSHWDAEGKHTKARAEMFAGLGGARIVEIGWKPWPAFRRAVSEVDVMISASFDETFCVVAADGIAEGVPSVVTGALEWAPRTWWADAWDQASVAHVGMGLLHDVAGVVHDGRQALTEYVETGTRKWIDYLCK